MRVFRVVPPNPLMMSGEERAAIAGELPAADRAARARARRVQFYVDARPVQPRRSCWPTCRARSRPRRAAAHAGRPARDRIALALAAVRGDGGVAAPARRRAGRGRRCRAYVVVPFTPRQTARAALAWRARARPTRAAPLERGAAGAPAGRAREPGARRRAARRARGARAADATCSTATACCGCCGRASTRPRPTAAAHRADATVRGARRARRARATATQARRAALALRARIAQLEPGLRASHRPRVDGRARRSSRRSYVHTHRRGRPRWAGCTARCSRASPTRSACLRARARPPPRAPADQARPTGGCSPSTAAPSSAGASPTSTATPRSTSTSSCWARWPASEQRRRLSRSRSTRRCAPAARAPDLAALGRGGRLLRRGDRVGRRLQGQPRRVPPARAVAQQRCRSAATSRGRARKYADPQRRPTWSRWSAPRAARRPGSRSRSPTPAAPSSC